MTEEDSAEDIPPSPFDAVSDLMAGDWEEKYERPRGMLTDTDRKFLRGVVEYSHENTAINRRKDIRGRVENGILDLFYLTMLEDRDREKVFDALSSTEPGELRSAVASLIQFIYLGLNGDDEWLEETLVHGIENAEYDRGSDDELYGQTKVEADITVSKGYNVEEIEERFRSGREHTLTPAEVGVLVRSGRVAPDELPALDSTYRDRINPETGELEDPGPHPTFGQTKPSVEDENE